MEVVGLAISAAIAAVMAPGALRAFAEAGWVRPNYRGIELAFPAGVIAVVAGIIAIGAVAALDRFAGTSIVSEDQRFLVLFGALDRTGGILDLSSTVLWWPLFLGVALLGLLDDLFNASPRGLRGHAKAVLGGGFSTGALKAIGTLALAIVVVTFQPFTKAEALLAVAVVVLATNMFNLLDLRPGRSVKAFVLLGGALVLITRDLEPVRTVGPFAGALLVLGAYDLREKAMLGDTGSNLLGAMAGVWIVTSVGLTGQLVALGLLVALTIFGEFRSISKAVDRFPPLRVLDSLGRPD